MRALGVICRLTITICGGAPKKACYRKPMEVHGTIAENLRNAIASAQRLRGHPVYPETIRFWRDLLHQARRARADLKQSDLPAVEALIEKLELEIAERPAANGQPLR